MIEIGKNGVPQQAGDQTPLYEIRGDAPGASQTGDKYPHIRVILMPGLELDASRKFRYGLHALSSALLILIAFAFVELRNCEWSPGINLKTLQGLHIALLLAGLAIYLLSLFGAAEFSARYNWLRLSGLVVMLILVGLMIWTTYEAAVNPCVSTYTNLPVDISFSPDKNVFTRNDVVGIIVLVLDIVATLLLISSTQAFYKGQ